MATLTDEDYALVEAATTRPIRNVTAAFSTTASACDFAGSCPRRGCSSTP